MKGTFVLGLWNAVTPSEYRSVLNFLDSPAHNRRADVMLLASLLARTPGADLERMDKQDVFEAVFPGEPFDNLRLNHTCSFLAQRLEAYFVWRELEQAGHWRDLFLCRALRRRGAGASFLRKTASATARLAAQPCRNAEHHLLRYLLESERYQYRVIHERETPDKLAEVTDPLHHFFMLENLRWSGTALSLRARYGADNPLPFAAAVLQEAERSDPATSPEIAMLHLAFQTLNDVENEDNFQRLKTLLAQKNQLFSSSENRDLYLLAINFCLRRHNRGERPAYTREALELYREALYRGFLFEQGLLQKFTYNNILRLACIAGERTWARHFLDDYQQYIPDEERANTYRFNLACWHYLGREYDRVPALLQTFGFSDRDTQLSARQMLLRSYFELQEWQALDSLLKSFYTFLRRRRDIGYQRDMYLNLIKFTKKLMAGPLSRRKAALLAARIRAEPNIVERDWLLEKTAAG